MKTLDDLLKYIGDGDVDRPLDMLDMRFVDMWGSWHHVSLPASQVNSDLLEKGIAFDGSSLGLKSVSAGDMVLQPDLETLHIDPFFSHGTLGVICNILEADTLKPFANDPRTVVQRAEARLVEHGFAEQSMWGPEFEFYIFDKIIYQSDINIASYRIDSEEADWNSGAEDGRNLGGTIPRKGGYHAMPPFDRLYDLRAEMARRIEGLSIPVRYHHHEVGGPGQSEIEIRMLPMLRAADAVMQIKYITRMVARRGGKTVTYMPKPLYNEAGNGMHFHQTLMRDGRSLFFDPQGPGGLSELGRFYIGGLLKHGRALLALTNPSTNSYKRLIPGFEAPVNLCYGLANRSAAVRIPKYVANPTDMRIEFRPPDGTSNPYLAMAAQLMAGLDGMINRIDPDQLGMGPINVDLRLLDAAQREQIVAVPTSLREALEALQEDQAFLLRGDVFHKDMLEQWCQVKMERESEAVRNRPHPYEMSLYFDC